MRRQEVSIEKLRYRFSPPEHLQNAESLAAKLDEVAEMKKEHEAIKADLKEREKRLESEIGRYTRLVRDQFEMRDIQCRWDYCRPTTEQKTLVRLDTNEDVREERMLDHERQEVLKFETPSHVLSGPGSFKDKKVSDVAESDIDYLASRDVEDLLKFGWIQVDIDAVFAEAKRRADEKAGKTPGPVAVEAQANVSEVGDASASVGDSALQFVAEAQAADAAAAASTEPVVSAGCIHCDEGVGFADADSFVQHDNGEPCPVGIRNSRIAKGEPEEIEPAHTLPSARAADGGTHARRRRGKNEAPKLPTAEERAQMEQAQAQQEATEHEQASEFEAEQSSSYPVTEDDDPF